MTDVELTRALERGEVRNEDFHHLSHLHVAWVYLAESPSIEDAVTKMRNTLRQFAASAGKAKKYHETITLFWIHLLGGLRTTNASLPQILEAHPQLLEKDFALTYYSPERLFSYGARLAWIEPDLKPLPVDVTAFCSTSPSGDAPDRALSECVAGGSAVAG
jgi:hypothetical protein